MLPEKKRRKAGLKKTTAITGTNPHLLPSISFCLSIHLLVLQKSLWVFTEAV